MDRHYLTPLFAPRSIVVFAGNKEDADKAAGDASLLTDLLLQGGYEGSVTHLDVSMSGTLSELAQARADLAIIVLPEAQLKSALEVAARLQCKCALIISAAVSPALARELQDIARHYAIELLGPNSPGFQSPHLRLNASVLGPLAKPGSLGLISQSGALTSAILDWAIKSDVGFSGVVSLGRDTVLDLSHALSYFTHDRNTQSILIYMEGITDARRFMSTLRTAAYVKPVIVMKAGRKPAGSSAALTHSGTIVGSDDVFDAALQRAGVVRVRSFVQLFSAAKCLAARYLPVGKRLAVISNGGGPGVLAADWANEIGLELGTLPADTVNLLRPSLSPLAQLESLIDLGEDATAEHYRAAVAACAQSTAIDGVLAIQSPKPHTDADAIAQTLASLQPMGKPLITCWLGDERASEPRKILARASIPSFRTPEAAVDAFNNIASFHQNQRLLYQTPPPTSPLPKPDIEGARILIESVLTERRNVLTEMESKALLSAFHIPITRTIVARSASEAMLVANQLGYPVALKINSSDISHKSDVGGVMLNLHNAAAVRDGWLDMMERVPRLHPDARIDGVTVQNMAGKPQGRELYIGMSTDAPFGPVITFGAGGTMIELIHDRAIELPPLNLYLAQRLIERARAADMLGVWRGAPAVERTAIEHVLLRVSEMVCALPQLREMDINPLIVDAKGAVAVDARIVIDHASSSADGYAHLAILPYPAEYEHEWHLAGGEPYTVRAIHPDDADILQDFVRRMSPESRYFRFVSTMRELPMKILARFTLIDYDREMALVAVRTEREQDSNGLVREREQMIAVSRYVTNADSVSCEFSLAVADAHYGQGIGARMMLSLMDFARRKGLNRIEGLVLANNSAMLKLMRSLRFEIRPYEEDPDFKLCTRQL